MLEDIFSKLKYIVFGPPGINIDDIPNLETEEPTEEIEEQSAK